MTDPAPDLRPDLCPDLCIVGAGSAGLSLAAAARAVGLSVVLVERGKMGGECLNTGCVPSKALLAAARHVHLIRRAAAFGISAGEPVIDFARVHGHVHATIGTIAPHDSEARFSGLGVTVIRESARFADPDTIVAGPHRIRAKRFAIATGSRPAVPDVPGLAAVPILTNESLFDLTALPRHLLVIGGGPVGLEMAQAFRRLGATVTLVQSSRLLPKDDPEAAAVVAERLSSEGVRLLTPARATAFDSVAGGVRATIATASGVEAVEASHVLVAAGRRPQLEGLDCAAGGIAVTDKGLQVDGALRSVSNRRVYALGDVAGSFQFTHWASHQAGLVLRSILTRVPARPQADRIAWCTFTDPELAQVGLTEAEARERHGDGVRIHRAPFSSNDRAVAERETEGFVKVVAGRRGRVLGATLVGAGAGELASAHALAVAGGLSVGAFARAVMPYPTLAETTKRAAFSAYSDLAGKPLAGLALRILRATL